MHVSEPDPEVSEDDVDLDTMEKMLSDSDDPEVVDDFGDTGVSGIEAVAGGFSVSAWDSFSDPKRQSEMSSFKVSPVLDSYAISSS